MGDKVDENKGLIDDEKKGQSRPGGKEDNEDWLPENPDPELKENNGPFDKKFAVWQVTIRLPIQGPLHLIALMYGFVPFILPGVIVIHWIITRHFLDLYAICICLFAFVLNEFILKKLLDQPRPRQTANLDKNGRIKHGMPSGHVINSACILFWALCELCFSGPGFENEEDKKVTTTWLVVVCLLTLPVPWARWHNSDHSVAQCTVSTILGAIIGPAGYYIRITHFPHHWKYWTPMLAHAATHVAGRSNHTKFLL